MFRLVFAALFFLLFGIVGSYRRKAQSGRTISYSKEGGAMFFALRLSGLTLGGYCLLFVAYPRLLGWSFWWFCPQHFIRWLFSAFTLSNTRP